jgi:hypothetical protein
MRMRTPFLAGAFLLTYAVPAAACTFYHTATYLSIPSRPTWGAGVGATFSDPTFLAISGDVAMKLGEKMVVRPGIGICSGNDETDPFFGASFGLNVSQSATMSFNVQSGISYLPFDGGSEMVIPVGVAAKFSSSGPMSFYAGGSLVWTQVDIDTFGSASNTDPMLFGGIMGSSGSIGYTLGAQLFLGDDSEFGAVAAVSLNSASSMIRHLGKAIRK